MSGHSPDLTVDFYIVPDTASLHIATVPGHMRPDDPRSRILLHQLDHDLDMRAVGRTRQQSVIIATRSMPGVAMNQQHEAVLLRNLEYLLQTLLVERSNLLVVWEGGGHIFLINCQLTDALVRQGELEQP